MEERGEPGESTIVLVGLLRNEGILELVAAQAIQKFRVVEVMTTRCELK
jgi:hypothetical protein